MIGLVVYAERGQVMATVASAWLQEHGVASSIRVERLDATGFIGAVRLGPPQDPDFVSDHVELAFTPTMSLRSVRVLRPRLKLGFDGRRLTFGSLQPLVDQALRARRSGGPGTDVDIQRGVVVLTTPVGRVQLTGDARMARGSLAHLDVAIRPARLAGPDGAVDIAKGRLTATGAPGGLKAQLSLAIRSGRRGRVQVSGALVEAQMDARMRGGAPAGPMRIAVTLAASQLRAGPTVLERPGLSFNFDGTVSGPLERLLVAGAGRGTGRAASLTGPRGLSGGALSALFVARGLQLARTADLTRLETDLELSGRMAELDVGGAVLSEVSAEGRLGRVQADAEARGSSVHADGRLRLAAVETRLGHVRLLRPGFDAQGDATVSRQGRARFEGRLDLAAGAPASEASRWAAAVPPIRAQAARELVRISASAPRVVATGGGAGPVTVSALAPIRVAGAGGAVVTMAQRAGAPLLRVVDRSGSGAFDLAAAGPTLPRLRLSAIRYQVGRDRAGQDWAGQDWAGLSGEVQGDAALSLDTGDLNGAAVKGLAVEASLRAERRGGVTQAMLTRCATARVLAYGVLASDVAADICPESAPLVRIVGAQWSAAAHLRSVQGVLVPAKLAITGSAGMTAQGGARPVRAEVVLAALTARDLQTERRFEPLAASGRLALGDAGWNGKLDLAAGSGPALGTLTLRGAADGGRGEVDLDTGSLRFAQGGLQPGSISALAPTWLTKVDGPARVTASLGWSGRTLSSRGRIVTPGLDFTSPAGRVTGARGAVALDSLAPPTTPPGQVLTADSVAWIAPLNAVSLRFQIIPDAVRLEGAKAGVSGGHVTLDPLTLSLSPGATTAGVLRISSVDLGALIARSSLADKFSLQGRLSGALPFAIGPAGVHIADGRLAADGPGRISLNRTAFAGAQVKSSGVQDIAYQALENLAFDTLDARIDSQPKGRLGVLFHIKGRHDPPHPVEARIGLFDLLAGHALDRSLPLPSGTPVNLTLDTSLNFDDLLAAYQRAAGRRSDPVQGRGAH